MSRLKIRHETLYSYSALMTFGPWRLLMRPLDTHAIRIVDASLELSPHGGTRWSYDAYGNCICFFQPGAPSNELKVVSKRQPDENEIRDLLFAWKVAKYVKSNAIVFAKDGQTAGIGAGQMNRRDSARIAAIRAAEAAESAGLPQSLALGSACASEAFFPFPDGLIQAAEAGATAVIQPGGSIGDEKVIAAADERGLTMAFTGVRVFRH